MKKKSLYPIPGCRKIIHFLVMKTSIVFLLLLTLQVNASVYSQQVKLDMDLQNATLKEVFNEIRRHSDFSFVYSDSDFKGLGKCNVQLKGATVDDILKSCLNGTNLEYSIVDKTIIIRKSDRATQQKQQKIIQGVVVDKTGSSLPGVTVLVKGTQIGMSTDVDGKFRIELPEMSDVVLVFSFVGMKSVEMKYSGQESMKVVLEEDVAAIEEVVVTGYFTKSKASYTGSVKTITSNELKSVSSSNIFAALSALTPGLEMVDRSELGSNPNQVPELLLRGMSSFSGSNSNQVNQPTIILDGVEITMQDLYDLDMNEIENITVLKDASATALYGSRAANGVIVVERKKLTVGNMRVSYNFSGNVQLPYLKDYNVLNAKEKLEYERLAGLYKAEGQKDEWGQELPAKEQWRLDSLYNIRLMDVNRGVNSDWLSQPARVAFSHDHSLRFYGGATNMRYELNGRFNNVQGVMKDDYRRRYNLGFRLQYHIQDKLTLANRTSYTEINTKDSPYGAFSAYTQMNPYDRMRNEFGKPNTELSWNMDNPLHEAMAGNRTTAQEKTFYNNTDVRWDINPLFRVNASFNITVVDGKDEKFLSPDSQTFKEEEDRSKKGSLVVGSKRGTSYSGKIVGAFNKMTENNSLISVNAGWEVNREHSETSQLRSIGYFDSELDFVGQGAGYSTTDRPSGSQTLSSEVGGFINGNYMYNNRYYADVVYRITGSSKFGKNNRYGQFWSAGLGWNLHNEKFLESSKLDVLKLRASTGYTGKVNFESFQAMTIYKYSGDLEYRNGIGAVPITIGNDDLKWERELSYNVGTDVSLFGRRLNFVFDVYLKKTTDLLLDQSKAPSTGITTGKENIGEMTNKGFEFQIDGFLVQRSDFYWQASFMGYGNRNKIDKISSALKEQNANNNDKASVAPLGQYEEGESVSALKVVRSAGIDPGTGKEVYYKRNGERTFDYDPADKVVVGDMDPKFRGSVSTNIFYKGFSLYVLGSFKCGGYLYNTTRAAKIEGTDAKYNVDKRAFNGRWREEGQIAQYKGIAIKGDTPKHTDRFVEKENVFTLTTLNLGYEFAPEVCSKLYVRNLRVGVNFTDLLRLSSVKVERGTSYLYSNGFEFTLSTTF